MDSEAALYRKLRSWWCQKYSRPMKDPMLQEYSLEDLMYEFYHHTHKEEYAEQQVKENDDKIEDKKMQEALDWAEKEELKELEQLRKMQEDGDLQDAADDSVAVSEEDVAFKPNQEQEEWMKKQLEKQMASMKELYGDDFGEDFTSEDD